MRITTLQIIYLIHVSSTVLIWDGAAFYSSVGHLQKLSFERQAVISAADRFPALVSSY